MVKHKPNLVKMRSFLKTCVDAPFKNVFDVKILEGRAKSIYKLKNIKILKRNITGLREVKILGKKNRDSLQEKKQTERKNDLVRSLAFAFV